MPALPGHHAAAPRCLRPGSVGAMSGTSVEGITAAVRRVLSVRGPMNEDDLLSALKTEGVDLGPQPNIVLAEVLERDHEPFMPLADGRRVWLPGLLEGRVFTHRLAEVEAAHDIITGLDCDLAPLARLAESETYQRLSDGSPRSARFTTATF